MTLWPIEDNAAIAAGIGLLGAAAWKIYLRIKRDTREDYAEAGQLHGYDAIIKQLREEVNRLAAQVTRMSEDLDAERHARYRAQESESRLQRRVDQLEAQVRSLGGTI
jgi:outer membrane murein-binding lipoprotein Lpp